MKLKLMIIGLLVFGFTFTSQAQTTSKRVTKTQLKQQKQIKHGVKTGKLTKIEAVKLQKQQRRIHKAKKRAKYDQVFTPKEKTQLRVQQRRAQAAIYKKKHNKRTRQ